MELFHQDLNSVHHYDCIYSIETELNTVLQAVLYLNTPHLQYTLCTVLLTLTLTALKDKLLVGLVAARNLTFSNHTQFKTTQLLMTCLPAMYSAAVCWQRSVLVCNHVWQCKMKQKAVNKLSLHSLVSWYCWTTLQHGSSCNIESVEDQTITLCSTLKQLIKYL